MRKREEDNLKIIDVNLHQTIILFREVSKRVAQHLF